MGERQAAGRGKEADTRGGRTLCGGRRGLRAVLRRFPLRVSPALLCLSVGVVLLLLLPGGRAALGRGGMTRRVLLPLLAAAGLHGCGHIFAAWCAGARVEGVELELSGARLRLGGLLSYRQEAAVAAGGPAVNLFCCLLSLHKVMSAGMPGEGYGGAFLTASLGLLLINLLPVSGMDGGRMLYCLTALFRGEEAARAVLKLTTAGALLLLCLFAVYALLRAGNMLSLAVFSFVLLLRGVEVDRRG